MVVNFFIIKIFWFDLLMYFGGTKERVFSEVNGFQLNFLKCMFTINIHVFFRGSGRTLKILCILKIFFSYISCSK